MLRLNSNSDLIDWVVVNVVLRLPKLSLAVLTMSWIGIVCSGGWIPFWLETVIWLVPATLTTGAVVWIRVQSASSTDLIFPALVFGLLTGWAGTLTLLWARFKFDEWKRQEFEKALREG